MRDLKNNIEVSQLYAPTLRTATVNSSGQDLRGYKSCMLEVQVGVRGDTWDGSNYVELELQESDDDSTYTAVANADCLPAGTSGTAVGTFATLNAAGHGSVAHSVGYRGNKRYVRVNIRLTGTHSSGTIFGVSAVCEPEVKPVA